MPATSATPTSYIKGTADVVAGIYPTPTLDCKSRGGVGCVG